MCSAGHRCRDADNGDDQDRSPRAPPSAITSLADAIHARLIDAPRSTRARVVADVPRDQPFETDGEPGGQQDASTTSAISLELPQRLLTV